MRVSPPQSAQFSILHWSITSRVPAATFFKFRPQPSDKPIEVRRRCPSLALAGAAVFFAGHLLALNPKVAVTQYMQAVWSTQSGLPQSSVYSIAQTPDGYLWFATEEGLARFDGMRFTVFDRGNGLPA